MHALKKWFAFPRVPLLRWSAGLFTAGTLLTIVIALRYFTVYTFPSEPLAVLYTIAAFTSHFASILLILYLVLVLLPVLVFPLKQFVIPWCILIVSVVTTLTLLDSQLYATHRFHFTFLTIKIFGATTWGFGLVYFFISSVFISFLARLLWEHLILKKKKLYLVLSLPITVTLLLFTHGTHIWADATAFVPVTSFTPTLPLFYPSTDKKRMKKMGFTARSQPNTSPTQHKNSDFSYPVTPLVYRDSTLPNILIIAVDDMRSDLMNTTYAPECMAFADSGGVRFTNHWSGGNSTKMGLFSFFYGIAPTYQQHIESNKIAPLLINRLQERTYAFGIFTSYRLDSPANLDVTAFVNIPNLRLETKLPGKHSPQQNDSAITDEWKTWLDNRPKNEPFFGFLFYDALCVRGYPEPFDTRLPEATPATELTREIRKYHISMLYIDSLIGSVLRHLDNSNIMSNTIVIITADHGDEFDDNSLGIRGHGSAFSDYQVRTPLIVGWPGIPSGIINKRTSHNDIVATLMKHGLHCTNSCSDYSSGRDLFSPEQWDWHIVGSYYNFAIIEPAQVTVQFPGGYFQVRDHQYHIIDKPTYSSHLTDALNEMGRFYRK